MDDGYLFFNVVPTEISVVDNTIDLEMRILTHQLRLTRSSSRQYTYLLARDPS
ncbi:MAG: hypothetical protein IPN60_19060 [Saprospiraceae bacterium]|nr:hypothetical protein [Candidatus Opimibacter skivensis]